MIWASSRERVNDNRLVRAKYGGTIATDLSATVRMIPEESKGTGDANPVVPIPAWLAGCNPRFR